MQNQELDLFLAEDWNQTNAELIRYTEEAVFKKSWRSAGALPEGNEPADIALEAIRKTFEWIQTGNEGPGYRKWNRDKYPTLLEHLKSAVDSELSNLVTKKEHLATNYSASADQDSSVEIFEKAISATETFSSPEAALLEKEEGPTEEELFVALLPQIYEELDGKEIATYVLMSYEELAKTEKIVKPQKVAEETGYSVTEVYNSLKQIRRAAIKVLEKGGKS